MGIQSTYGLDQHGLAPTQVVHWNLSPAELIEAAIRRGEGQLTKDGPFLAITKPHTGRSPNDKYTVREASSEADIWWGNNNALSEAQFDELHRRALAYLNERDIFARDLYACADPANRLRVRLIEPANGVIPADWNGHITCEVTFTDFTTGAVFCGR